MIRRLILFVGISGVLLTAERIRPEASPTTDDQITSIQSRLKETPKNATILNELAGAYLQKMRETGDGGYLDRADKIVNTILQSEPSNYDARRRYIEIELQRHQFQQAVTSANTLARERPEDPILWGQHGDALMEMGDYDNAADVYQKMADLRPSLAS